MFLNVHHKVLEASLFAYLLVSILI